MTTDRRARPLINPPIAHASDEPGYLNECTFAVEESIESLIDYAVAAGWKLEVVKMAIVLAASRDMDHFQMIEGELFVERPEKKYGKLN